jgi:hypothetical protein
MIFFLDCNSKPFLSRDIKTLSEFKYYQLEIDYNGSYLKAYLKGLTNVS